MEEGNRWLKLAKLIPWKELEGKYAEYGSDRGRPGTDGRLAVGLFLLKHLSGKSDVEFVLELLENPYGRSFCGLETFATAKTIEASRLSQLRKRLGPSYVRDIEEATYQVVMDKKILPAKGMLADGTVIPENIKYPNDVGLWLVAMIKRVRKDISKKDRTYGRKGGPVYLNFGTMMVGDFGDENVGKVYWLATVTAQQMGKNDLAYDYAKKMIEANPAPLNNALYATTLFNLGKRQEALEIAREAATAEPNNPKIIEIKNKLVGFMTGVSNGQKTK